MSYLQIFKRIIPFFLTFAAGLLIASIFVPISAPNFRKAERPGKWGYNKEYKRRNHELRRENDRLRQELNSLRLERDAKFTNLDFPVPDFHVEPPAPPMPSAPRATR